MYIYENNFKKFRYICGVYMYVFKIVQHRFSTYNRSKMFSRRYKSSSEVNTVFIVSNYNTWLFFKCFDVRKYLEINDETSSKKIKQTITFILIYNFVFIKYY